MEKTHYTVKEFAELCRITPHRVRGRIKDGNLKAEKLGNFLIVITAEEVERQRSMGRLKSLEPKKKV